VENIEQHFIYLFSLLSDQQTIDRTANSSEPNKAQPSTSRVENDLSPFGQSSNKLTCSMSVKTVEDPCYIKCGKWLVSFMQPTSFFTLFLLIANLFIFDLF
jgi:hypothetical protein